MFVIFLGFLASLPIFSLLKEWKRELCFGVHSVPIKTLLSDIDAISKRLGRVPKDEAELVKLRGKPMPEISRGLGGDFHRIDYYATDANHFWLEIYYDEEFWYYYSSVPQQGWHSFEAFEW